MSNKQTNRRTSKHSKGAAPTAKEKKLYQYKKNLQSKYQRVAILEALDQGCTLEEYREKLLTEILVAIAVKVLPTAKAKAVIENQVKMENTFLGVLHKFIHGTDFRPARHEL